MTAQGIPRPIAAVRLRGVTPVDGFLGSRGCGRCHRRPHVRRPGSRLTPYPTSATRTAGTARWRCPARSRRSDKASISPGPPPSRRRAEPLRSSPNSSAPQRHLDAAANLVAARTGGLRCRGRAREPAADRGAGRPGRHRRQRVRQRSDVALTAGRSRHPVTAKTTFWTSPTLEACSGRQSSRNGARSTCGAWPRLCRMR